jgi:SNF2 family DNA or RNA helicase
MRLAVTHGDGEAMTPFVVGGPARFEHQRKGLQKLIATGGVAGLLFDPGLGKTATVLDYAGLLALKSQSGEARVLVVCPLVAVDTWVMQAELFMSPMVNVWAESLGGSLLQRAEALASRGGNGYPRGSKSTGRRAFDRHHPRALHHDKALAWFARSTEREENGRPVTPSEGPDGLGTAKPRVVLEVINIDTLSSRAAVKGKTMADVQIDAIRRFAPDLLVVDESHKIKSAMGNASRLLGRTAKFVRRRVILTGTVMPHSPLDVFGQWRFLEPYAFGDRLVDGSVKQATAGSFKSRYAELGGWMGKEVIGYKNLDDMQAIMARNAVVARKAEALDLPPTTDVVIPVELSPEEKRAYSDMRDQLAVQLASGQLASVPNRLAQMMRLRQITSGHLPDDNGVTNVIGTSKAQTIRSLVQDTLAGENRVVIFALFTAEIALLVKILAEPGTEVMEITGGTSNEDRQLMRKRFGDTANHPGRIVMVAQIKTMSLAVNELITASHAVFASLSYQRDDWIQAKDRLDRIGQTKPCTFWHAIAPGTVDGVILRSHRDRTNLEDAVLRHIQQREGDS